MQGRDIDAIYGRDALVIYLRDVLDLEVLQALFSQKYNEGEHNLRITREQLLTENKVAPQKKSNAIFNGCLIYILVACAIPVLGMLALGIILPILGVANADTSEIALMPLGVLSAVAPLLVLCIPLVIVITKRRKTNVENEASAAAHNANDDERLRRNWEIYVSRYEQPWMERRAFLQKAYWDVHNVLEETYALNITPVQYRNLASAQYLYEFMSTSHQTFEQALDHAQRDDAIRRIEARLNVIIQQNEQQLRELASIRSNTETLINQQRAILAAQVAQTYYASVSAAHDKAMHAKIDNLDSYIRYGY